MSKTSDRYVRVVAWSEEDQCYIGRCPGLMLGRVHGSDERAVYAELCEAVEEWLRLHKSEGGHFPSRHLFGKSKPSFEVIRSAIRKLQASSLPDAATDLQLLALNLHRRWRCDNRLFTGRIRDWFNHPLPAGMAVLIHSPGCAAAFPDLHSPVSAVGGNCEYNRDRGCDHHSAQHSNEK